MEVRQPHERPRRHPAVQLQVLHQDLFGRVKLQQTHAGVALCRVPNAESQEEERDQDQSLNCFE